MHTRYSMGAGALAAVFLSSTASFAQVTPQQVWDNWRGYLEGYGYAITAKEMPSGSGLDVTGLNMTMPLPEDGGTVGITFGEMRFVDNGDGTVAIVMPETSPVSVSVRPTEGETVDMAFTYYLPGMQMVAKGTPQDMKYIFTGDEVSLELNSLVVDGAPLNVAKFQMGFAGLSGDWSVKSGDLRVIEQNLIAEGGMRYQFAANDPEGQGTFSVRGQTERVNMAGKMAIPMVYDPNDVYQALQDGMAFDFEMAFGKGQTEFSFRDGDSFATGSSSTTGSSFAFAMSKANLRYGTRFSDLAVALAGSDIPLPINFTAQKLIADMSMPLAKSDVPQDLSALIKVEAFAPDEMIWGMLDPTGAMPHDPATMIIDLAAKANWLFDALDPANAAALNGKDIPFEIYSLSLNQLKVSAAGAELTGEGSFVFNNDDLETFDGLPAPDGSVNLRLVGANGLLDTLISMGLMSDDDAMGMRMMMGMFGRPGDAEDEILSTIEVKSNGQILANGQRLQ